MSRDNDVTLAVKRANHPDYVAAFREMQVPGAGVTTSGRRFMNWYLRKRSIGRPDEIIDLDTQDANVALRNACQIIAFDSPVISVPPNENEPAKKSQPHRRRHG